MCVNYRLGKKFDGCTKEEAIEAFIKSANFKAFAKSRFYTVYKTEQII